MAAYEDLAALIAAKAAYESAEAAARAAETAYRGALATVQADIAAAGGPITAEIDGVEYTAGLEASGAVAVNQATRVTEAT